MQVTFSFFDRAFHKHGYAWECDLPCLPAVGHVIALPDLPGGGPLREGEAIAEFAEVKEVTWWIEEEPTVAVYCDILW